MLYKACLVHQLIEERFLIKCLFLGKPNGMVEPVGDIWPWTEHQEGSAREQQVEWLGWGDERDGGEDDVRPEAEGDGEAHQRRAEETGHDEEVHGRSPWDGLQQVQIQLNQGITESWKTATYQTYNRNEACYTSEHQ